jgi:multisubunit Na+/H+ antiporter MnhF subunit
VTPALHSPRFTLAALYATIVAIAAAIAPVVGTLVGMHNPLATLFGPTAADKVVAASSIVSGVCAAIGARATARGRSIVPAVDDPDENLSKPNLTQPASPK